MEEETMGKRKRKKRPTSPVGQMNERIAQRKVKEKERENITTSSGRFVTIPLEKNLILVDRGNAFIDSYEIKEPIVDLFSMKRDFEMGEKIELSKVADVMFDLVYQGTNNNKEIFKLCQFKNESRKEQVLLWIN